MRKLIFVLMAISLSGCATMMQRKGSAPAVRETFKLSALRSPDGACQTIDSLEAVMTYKACIAVDPKVFDGRPHIVTFVSSDSIKLARGSSYQFIFARGTKVITQGPGDDDVPGVAAGQFHSTNILRSGLNEIEPGTYVIIVSPRFANEQRQLIFDFVR